jgi:alpha-galactosidase
MINWEGVKTESAKLISIDFNTLGLSGKQNVRNLWLQKNIGTFDGRFETEVNYHGVDLIKLSAIK